MEAVANTMKTHTGWAKRAEPVLLHYEKKNVNLTALVTNIEKWFKERNFTTQTLQAQSKWLIQGTKQGIWRSITASARAYSIRIDGSPDDFKIEIGVGKWINNTTSLAIITILSGTLLLPFCGAAALWSKKISRDLKNYIELTIDFVAPSSD